MSQDYFGWQAVVYRKLPGGMVQSKSRLLGATLAQVRGELGCAVQYQTPNRTCPGTNGNYIQHYPDYIVQVEQLYAGMVYVLGDQGLPFKWR